MANLPADAVNEILKHIDSIYDVLSLICINSHYSKLKNQLVIHTPVDTRNQPHYWFFDRALTVRGMKDYPMAKTLILNGPVSEPLHEGLLDLTLDYGPAHNVYILRENFLPKSLKRLHYNIPRILPGNILPSSLEVLVVGDRYPIFKPIDHIPCSVVTLKGPCGAFKTIPFSVKSWTTIINSPEQAKLHGREFVPNTLESFMLIIHTPRRLPEIKVPSVDNITLMVHKSARHIHEYIKLPEKYKKLVRISTH